MFIASNALNKLRHLSLSLSETRKMIEIGAQSCSCVRAYFTFRVGWSVRRCLPDVGVDTATRPCHRPIPTYSSTWFNYTISQINIQAKEKQKQFFFQKKKITTKYNTNHYKFKIHFIFYILKNNFEKIMLTTEPNQYLKNTNTINCTNHIHNNSSFIHIQVCVN